MTIVYKAYAIEGLEADSKPTNVQTNRRFFETDTGLFYNFNGSTWDQVGGSVATTSNGTYTHANGTTEDTAISITANEADVTIAFDVSLLTQNTTIRVKEEVDGTTAEIQSEKVFPTDFDTNVESVIVSLVGKGRDQVVTFQSGTSEGASRDIPWSRRDA
jgi:hypothetical protein